MAIPKPIPLFPPYAELKGFDWVEYPQLNEFFAEQPDWCREHWTWAKDYLLYLGRNKSEHTFIRFRSDVEKFLLWSFLIAEKPLDQFKKSEVLNYADFFYKPPQSWISLTNVDKFQLDGGLYIINKAWRPFRYIAEGSEANKKKISSIA